MKANQLICRPKRDVLLERSGKLNYPEAAVPQDTTTPLVAKGGIPYTGR
jgi:hypothetical protein